MRVCLVTGSQPVDYTRFLDREAASLACAGHEVHLIGLPPTHHPGAKQNVTLHVLPSRAGIGKWRTIKDVAETVTGLGPDACHCCDPWSLAAGLRLRRQGAIRRLVYDATEDFPAAYGARGDLGALAAAAAKLAVTYLERQACDRADAIIETNSTRARRFERLGRTVRIVGNFPPLGVLPEPRPTRTTCFVYTGPITRHRGFLQLLEALACARRHFGTARLRVIGDYDPRDDIRPEVERLLKERQLERAVQFMGRLDYATMFSSMADCLAGVILLQRSRLNDYTGQPNKLFEFMGSGLAVIASDFPEMGPVLRRESCGIAVDSSSPDSIAAAMVELLGNHDRAAELGLKGRAAVRERYNWATAEQTLLGVYRDLAC